MDIKKQYIYILTWHKTCILYEVELYTYVEKLIIWKISNIKNEMKSQVQSERTEYLL